jgi:hypothetical protein
MDRGPDQVREQVYQSRMIIKLKGKLEEFPSGKKKGMTFCGDHGFIDVVQLLPERCRILDLYR